MSRMLSLVVCTFILLTLLACGGNAETSRDTEGAGTTTDGGSAAPAAGSPAPATATADNSVELAEEGALNDSFATAILLEGSPVEGSVNESELYYKINLPASAIVTGTLDVVAGSPAPLTLTFYNMEQNLVEEITVPVGETQSLSYIFSSEQKGTVFFSVRGEAAFALSGTSAVQDDGGSGGDAGADTPEAVEVDLGSFAGLVGGADMDDFYRFELPTEGGTLAMTLDVTSGSVTATLLDVDGNFRDEASAAEGDEPVTVQQTLAENEGGEWAIRVYGAGAYAITVQFGGQNDGGSGGDAGSDYDATVPVELGTIEGQHGGMDTDDFYLFTLPEGGGVLELSAEAGGDELNVEVYNRDQNYITALTVGAGERGSTQQVLALGEGGEWYLRALGSSGNYEVTLAFTDQDDGGSGGDAPDSAESALPVGVGDAVSGLLGGGDFSDHYLLESEAGNYTLSLTTDSEEGLTVTLYDADGNYLGEGSSDGGTLELPFDTTSATTANVAGAGSYEFTVIQ